MIVEFIQKHRRIMMLFVIVFIGIPLAFWVPTGGSGESGARFDASFPVAQVGSTPITAEQFLARFNQIVQQRSQGGLPVTALDLVNDGTVETILDALIREAMITNETREAPVYPEQDFLTERLQEDPFFQNDAGEFDKGLYNQWVEGNIKRGFDWDGIFDGLADSVNREVYLELLGASARVLDSELREEFEASRTKLRIRAAAIEPPIELSEEELQAHYDENLQRYMTPEERRADFFAVSLKPPRPALVDELVERARSGEDFADLAREHSESLDSDEGGDMGWINETETLPEHQKPLLELAVGDVSDVIESVAGLHIYKVGEERTNEDGEREIRARQITIRPRLTEEERAERMDRAQALFAAAVEADGDLQAAATAENAEVESTGVFSVRSSSIDNIPNVDTFQFRQKMTALAINEVSEVIESRDNLYVGVITDILQPIQRSFEDARADVERDAINLHKNGPEYLGRVAEYSSKIQEGADSLEEIREMFPELDFEIKETEDFGLTDMLFTQGLFLDTRQAFGALRDREPGQLSRPVLDFSRVTHFLELVERTPPGEEVWEAEWEDERERLRDAILSMRQISRQSDYLQFLREQAADEAMIQLDYDAVFTLLGLDDSGSQSVEAPIATPQSFQDETTDSEDDEPIVLDLDDEE